MKNLFLFFLTIASIFTIIACKTETSLDPYSQILKSGSITEVENFLQNSDKYDPRRAVLRTKLIALKNVQQKKETLANKQEETTPTYAVIERPQSERSNNIKEEEERIEPQKVQNIPTIKEKPVYTYAVIEKPVSENDNIEKIVPQKVETISNKPVISTPTYATIERPIAEISTISNAKEKVELEESVETKPTTAVIPVPVAPTLGSNNFGGASFVENKKVVEKKLGKKEKVKKDNFLTGLLDVVFKKEEKNTSPTRTKKEDALKYKLRPKFIAKKNAELKKNAPASKQLIAVPTYKVIPAPNSVTNTFNSEDEEFKTLMTKNESTGSHQKKTVQLLNALFDQDISSKDAILLVQNRSDCNMILRIQGKDNFYNLAIPTKGESSLVVLKGDYILNSNVCDVKYSSIKKIVKNMLITLSRPTVQSVENNHTALK